MRLRVQWLVVGAVVVFVGSVAVGLLGAEPDAPECDKLAVLWSSGDPDGLIRPKSAGFRLARKTFTETGRFLQMAIALHRYPT